MFNYYKVYDIFYTDQYLKTLDFRQLYLKLYLEMYIRYFKYIADFKAFYNLLDICKNEIVHINLFISEADCLKSDYNYIRAAIGRLVKLKQLDLNFSEGVSLKLIKNIIKGINLFNEANGELNNLSVRITGHPVETLPNNNKCIYSDKDFNILTIIDKLPRLKILDLCGSNLDRNASLRIRNHLYYFKSLELLNLNGCAVDDEIAKEIADEIMKAKSLETIYLRNNKMSKGLVSILYNLAFQPSLKIVDISCNSCIDAFETGTALYKLIKMSQSLEVLVCRDMPLLIDGLTKEFFYALGDNSSLKYLDLCKSGNISLNNAHCSYFGHAIALNALKKGALRTLLLSDVGMKYTNFTKFIEEMHVSEKIHFEWYGTSLNTNIQKDSKEFYEKKFYCQLAHLDLSGNNMNCYIDINDLKATHSNYLKILIEQNLALENLNFSRCNFNKYFVFLIVNALQSTNNLRFLSMENSGLNGDLIKHFVNAFYKSKDKKEENKHIHLEGLDLANNQFGYSGIEALSRVLKENKTIRILNLYKNFFDVNGTRRLKEALEVNCTLEALDIGFNRIKDLGFTNIIEGIISNPENIINFLSCRYSLIKNAALLVNMQKIFNHPNSKIKELELTNNIIDDKVISKIYNELYLQSNRKIKIEMFECLHHLLPEKMERTAWISPLNSNITTKHIENSLKIYERDFVLKTENSRLGIPLSISIKRSKYNVKKRMKMRTVDAFVEFMHPNSVNRLLKMASTEGLFIDGKRVRSYKAGTKTEKLLLRKRNR